MTHPGHPAQNKRGPEGPLFHHLLARLAHFSNGAAGQPYCWLFAQGQNYPPKSTSHEDLAAGSQLYIQRTQRI